ncbi:unnamed protein product [Closterium sp. NIES-54]
MVSCGGRGGNSTGRMVKQGAGSGGAEPWGVEPGGTEPAGAEPGGAESAGAELGGAECESTPTFDIFLISIFLLHLLLEGEQLQQERATTTLISDRDPKFTSKFWKELMSLMGTRLAMSSAYHPQTDGQTEHLNQIVEQLLRATCKDDINKWDLHLPVLEFAYNNAKHAATGETPFFLCYGRHPLTPQQPTVPATVQPAHDFVTTMQQLWNRTHKRLQDIQSSQKRLADRHQRDHTIAVGDHVLLDTCNLNLGHLPSKLRPRFCGPFLVEEQVTPVTFRLRLPASWKIHNAFHEQLLKPYQDPNKLYTGRQPLPPPPVLVNDELEYEVESVLAHRHRRHGALEFLVSWKGYDPSEDSWVSQEQVTPVTFRLRLPASWKIHNAFHVQLLKPYQDPNKLYTGRQPLPPPPVLVNDELEYEVESVLAHRHRRHGALEFLTKGLTERREPVSRPLLPVCSVYTSRRVPVSRTHHMALRPSSIPLRVPLQSPCASSLADGPDPESDLVHAASPTVPRLLATVVIDPSFESAAASSLVAELVDFAAACRLDYAASLVAESKSDCPPSVGGECALGTDVLEDKQEDFECFAAALPHLVSMLIAPEGDLDAPDIPTTRSNAEAITGPYSSQWQTAMDAEMAS